MTKSWEDEKKEPHALLYCMYQTEDRTVWPEIEGVYRNYEDAWNAMNAKGPNAHKSYVIKHLKAKVPNLNLRVVVEGVS